MSSTSTTRPAPALPPALPPAPAQISAPAPTRAKRCGAGKPRPPPRVSRRQLHALPVGGRLTISWPESTPPEKPAPVAPRSPTANGKECLGVRTSCVVLISSIAHVGRGARCVRAPQCGARCHEPLSNPYTHAFHCDALSTYLHAGKAGAKSSSAGLRRHLSGLGQRQTAVVARSATPSIGRRP